MRQRLCEIVVVPAEQQRNNGRELELERAWRVFRLRRGTRRNRLHELHTVTVNPPVNLPVNLPVSQLLDPQIVEQRPITSDETLLELSDSLHAKDGRNVSLQLSAPSQPTADG